MSCPEFIAQSFAVRTAAHQLHLSSTSYAQHVALNEFYDDLLPLVDRYAEVYMGLEGQIKKFPTATVPVGNPVDTLEDYLELVLVEQKDEHGSQGLMNILAEIEEVTAQTLYKLRFLK